MEPAAHDVEGLDWALPTLGERGPLPPPPAPEVRARLLAAREDLRARARAALSPPLRARFDHLVGEAHRAHAAREEQTRTFTPGWPVMRRCLLGIGSALVDRGVLGAPEDVFFLTRAELDVALVADLGPPPVRERRATRRARFALTPPLQLGTMAGPFRAMFAAIGTLLHHDEHDAPDALRGMPGSPGRVTGVARVIRSVDELRRLRAGEILVAPVTTPGWTLAFGRAAAVVTDTGSIASHASIVAREYGIPAVVGTGDATHRITDGQRVTVDGARGVIRLSPDDDLLRGAPRAG